MSRIKYKEVRSKDFNKRFFRIFILCGVVFSTFLLSNYFTDPIQDKKKHTINYTQEDIDASNGYLLVDPINITSWSDWALYPFITGNGTDLNPFIIENIEIIGTGPKTIQSGNRTTLDYTYGGIYINTNGSFVIRNCRISKTSIGIHFSISIPPGDYQYQIINVEITDCSMGIYSYWPHVSVNISNCYISRCQWVSISATININDYVYGGIGIRIRSDENSAIEDCQIEDCSIGVLAEMVETIRNNKLIGCGIVPGAYIPNYSNGNTVNGKPLGLFWGVDNLVFTQTDASKYGQLIFISCANLTLSNIHITKSCSIGIQLYSTSLFQKTYLNNIICENQNLGFYIYGCDIIANNLYAKNCKAGFFFNDVSSSEFTRVMTDNTNVPIYASILRGFTIEIEQTTEFYFVDPTAWYDDKLHIESSSTSYNISMAFISKLDFPGYTVQFNDTNSYQVTLWLQHHVLQANFTVISVPHYPRPDVSSSIPGYPIFWLWSMIIIGIVIYIKSSRRILQK